jgi:nicotinamide-nucleotide amidase
MSVRRDELAKRVLEAAKACNVTLATAESCTAGAIASTLSASPPAGDIFHGGVVAYSKQMKEDMLGVPHDLLRDKGAVCAEVAQAMARGVLARCSADLAVAITGVAGPEPHEDGNPVGLIYCACARRNGEIRSVCLHSRQNGREAILEDGICAALGLLLAECGDRSALSRGQKNPSRKHN